MVINSPGKSFNWLTIKFFSLTIIVTAAFCASARPASNPRSLASADSAAYELRTEYLICTGDTTTLTMPQLNKWKRTMDSLIADNGYKEKFDSYVRATGLRPQDVKPCEPVIFFERFERQLAEMDNFVETQRKRREKTYRDSMSIVTGLKKLKPCTTNILGIPAGISKEVLLLILARDSIKSTQTPDFLRVDSVEFEGMVFTAALYFDERGRYYKYEMETKALAAQELDKTVREWANLLAKAYEKRLGLAGRRNRIGFHDIRQGQLSISMAWRGTNPTVLVGLAVHNNLYYAKTVVTYDLQSDKPK